MRGILKPMARRFATVSPYQVLGIPQSATQEQIKEAFLKLTKQMRFSVGQYGALPEVN